MTLPRSVTGLASAVSHAARAAFRGAWMTFSTWFSNLLSSQYDRRGIA